MFSKFKKYGLIAFPLFIICGIVVIIFKNYYEKRNGKEVTPEEVAEDIVKFGKRVYKFFK